MSVLLSGHSFIKRLQKSLKDKDNPFSVPYTVDFHGIPGGMAKMAAKDFTLVIPENYKMPEILILQTGGNDIGPETTAKTVADDILSIVRQAYGAGVKRVVVCSLYSRPKPRKMKEKKYEKVKNAVNEILKKKLDEDFWLHKLPKVENRFLKDGVHLNDKGMKEFFKSLRAAMVKAKEALDVPVKDSTESK